MKKTKLRSSVPVWVASFLFVASWVVFGVAFALKTVNVGLNGQVTFTATGVYAKVTGSVTGTKTTNTLNDITIDASTTEDNQSWDNVAFDFIDEDTSIVTTIKVENLSTERSLYVTFEENINVNNITISRTLESSPVTSTFSTTTIPHSSSKTFVITMKVDDKNKSVSGEFDFNINLSSEEVKQASEYSTLSFTYNEANGTASVAKNSDNLPTGDLIIPSQVIYNNKLYEVTKVDSQAFEGCTGLTSVVIPESVTSIGILSFYECEELTSVTMPSKITSIEAETFSHCTKLTNISIPENVISIGSSSFSTCTSLTSITIPSKVTDIGNYAFLDCSSLTSLTIPSSVTNLGQDVFTRDTSLKTIFIDSNTVSNGLTEETSCGRFLQNATTIYIKEGCSTSSSTYLTSNFTQTTSDQSGYVKWVKN